MLFHYKPSFFILQCLLQKGEATARVPSKGEGPGRGFRGINGIFRSAVGAQSLLLS
jgi:hypothetical protein